MMLAQELIEQLPLALSAARDLSRQLKHDACAEADRAAFSFSLKLLELPISVCPPPDRLRVDCKVGRSLRNFLIRLDCSLLTHFGFAYFPFFGMASRVIAVMLLPSGIPILRDSRPFLPRPLEHDACA